EGGDGFGTVGGDRHGVAVQFKIILRCKPNGGVIIDDQHVVGRRVWGRHRQWKQAAGEWSKGPLHRGTGKREPQPAKKPPSGRVRPLKERHAFPKYQKPAMGAGGNREKIGTA